MAKKIHPTIEEMEDRAHYFARRDWYHTIRKGEDIPEESVNSLVSSTLSQYKDSDLRDLGLQLVRKTAEDALKKMYSELH